MLRVAAGSEGVGQRTGGISPASLAGPGWVSGRRRLRRPRRLTPSAPGPPKSLASLAHMCLVGWGRVRQSDGEVISRCSQRLTYIALVTVFSFPTHPIHPSSPCSPSPGATPSTAPASRPAVSDPLSESHGKLLPRIGQVGVRCRIAGAVSARAGMTFHGLGNCSADSQRSARRPRSPSWPSSRCPPCRRR